MAATQLLDSVYYVPGDTNVGFVAFGSDSEAQGAGGTTRKSLYLIDSGMDEYDAKRIHAELKETFPEEAGGFDVPVIINTHSHADHSGGNAYFARTFGSRIWISRKEAGSLQNPDLQGIVISRGHPFPQVQCPFYLAEPSEASRLIDDTTEVLLPNGAKISFLSLPGHYFEMLGVLVTAPDGKTALFAGDAFFGRHHIGKYWIPFLFDVAQFKQSLDKLASTPADVYLPSHGEPITYIEELTELNKIAILSTEQSILNTLRQGALSSEAILKALADANEITLRVSQYTLISSTVQAYLMYLYDTKRVQYKIRENILLWSLAPDAQPDSE